VLNLAIDRKIDSIFDLNDAMKLQTDGDHIVAIEGPSEYDAIDTGLFILPARDFQNISSGPPKKKKNGRL